MLFAIALYEGCDDPTPKPLEVEWSALIADLSDPDVTDCDPCPGHSCEKKKIHAWSPLHFPMENPTQRKQGDAVTIAVFDLDGITDEQQEKIAEAIQGHQWAIHSTHAPGSYRLLMPLARSVPVAAWPDTWRDLVARFGLPADPHRKDFNGLYFYPSVPASRRESFEFYTGEGQLLEPDFGGAESPRRFLVQAETVSASETDEGSSSEKGPIEAGSVVDLALARKQLTSIRRAESALLVRRAIKGEPLAQPGERDSNVHRLAHIIAATCEPVLPTQAALELMRSSIAAMPCEPEGFEAWMAKAEFSYERALQQRSDRDAREENERAIMYRILGRRDPKAKETPEPDPEDDWRKDLLFMTDKAGDPISLRQCGANAGLILLNDPVWKGTLRFNLITKTIDVTGGPLTGVPRATHEVEAANWLARSDYRLSLHTGQVGEQLLATARHNDYNPLADWLRGLKWDAKPRIKHWLETYLGVKTDERNRRHIWRVSERWLIAAVARALKPGTFVKNVLILRGAQDAKKSTALKILGGDYFSDTSINIRDKDSRMAASRFWIIEIGELSAFRGADVENLKAFFSARADDIRPPYGKVLETFNRCCVFVGTTNLDEFLSDPTGNSRYWPVQTGKIDVEALANDRDQLFAEAVASYEAGAKFWLEGNDALEAESFAREFAHQSIRIEPILAWILDKAPGERQEYYTLTELATDGLGLLRSQLTKSVAIEVGHALRDLGFEKHRVRIGQQPIWCYKTPDELLKVKKTKMRLPIVDYLQPVKKADDE